MRFTACLLVAVMLLAGCTAPDDDVAPDETDGASIRGLVVNPALLPMEGARVQILGTSLENTTNADGTFHFDDVPLRSEPPILLVRLDGYRDLTHALPEPLQPGDDHEIRVELQYAAIDEPYREHMPFNGFIACSALVAAGHSHGGADHEDDQTDCSANAPSDDVWEFQVDAGVENVVIEVAWDADTQAAEYLSMTIHGVGVDDGNDIKFYFTEGTSPLRGVVSQLQADTYYREGGAVRVSIAVAGPDSDYVVSAAVNQQFQVIASAFYVEPGPSDYSIANASE